METTATARAPSDGRSHPFQIRGALQTILSLRLQAPDDPNFFALLLDKVAHAPDFFRDAPVVLDVGPLADQPPIDLDAMVTRLRSHRLFPVGIQNGSPAWIEAASRLGLARFGTGGTVAERQAEPAPAARTATGPAPARPAAAQGPSRVIRDPVRGGQQIVANDGDLVVMGPVAHGAEVAAAGHIHIYGALRGRAFAGINGDDQAIIFCDQLEAELVSIAGVYLVNEAIDPKLMSRRVRITTDGERLLLHPIP